MTATPSQDSVRLELADEQLLAEIRKLATALVDGPARWDALHAQICEAKKRKIHRKLGVNWAGFLGTFGLGEDDWSRIAVAVDVCAVLRGAGLPLPRNHGQLDQLRHLRRAPDALRAFWSRAISHYGSVPPARVLAGMKSSERVAAPNSGSNACQSSESSAFVSLAKQYRDLMRAGKLFEAQTPAQQLAAIILGLSAGNPDEWRIWPTSWVQPRQLQFGFDDARRVIANGRRAARGAAAKTDDRQLHLNFDDVGTSAYPEKLREIRGIPSSMPQTQLGVANGCAGSHSPENLNLESTPPTYPNLVDGQIETAVDHGYVAAPLDAATGRSATTIQKDCKDGDRVLLKLTSGDSADGSELVRHGPNVHVKIAITFGKGPHALSSTPPGYVLTRMKRSTRLEKRLRDLDVDAASNEVTSAIHFVAFHGTEPVPVTTTALDHTAQRLPPNQSPPSRKSP